MTLTPQEQAEELTSKAAREYYEERCELVNDAIKQEIPLPELIAVAQAANKVATEKSIMNQMQAEFEMLKALDTLRATGKVTL